MHNIQRVRDLAQILCKSVGESNLNVITVPDWPHQHEAPKSVPTVRIWDEPHYGLVARSDLRIPRCHASEIKSDSENHNPQISISLDSAFLLPKNKVDFCQEHSSKEEKDIVLAVISAVKDECANEAETYSSTNIPNANCDEEKEHGTLKFRRNGPEVRIIWCAGWTPMKWIYHAVHVTPPMCELLAERLHDRRCVLSCGKISPLNKDPVRVVECAHAYEEKGHECCE